MSVKDFDEKFYAQNPYGSSRLGGFDEALELSVGGAPIGYFEDIYVRMRHEEPTVIFGGAGSGKFAQLGAYQLVHSSVKSFFVLDPNGQYMSESWHWNLSEGRKVYAINPENVGAYSNVQHALDLFAFLKNDKFLFDNARRVAEMALSTSKNAGENAWVGQSAKRWITRLLIMLVLLEGRVTPRRLWEVINEIDARNAALVAWCNEAQDLPNDVQTTLVEILRKKKDSAKEYGAIMGDIKSDLDWLSSDPLADSISGDHDFLAELTNPDEKVGVYYTPKAGKAKTIESYTNMVVGIAMIHCVNANNGSKPLFYLEEAAHCGSAEFIKSAVSEFRKYFSTVLVYQSLGQMYLKFTPHGAQEILESCGTQVFLGGGIRDGGSASKVADMIGKTSIETTDPHLKAQHLKMAEKAGWEFMMSGNTDDLESFYNEVALSEQGKIIKRCVIDSAELMQRTGNKILVLAPGKALPPLLINKLPQYWTNRAMVGRYGPDPQFLPLDQVIVAGAFGFQRKKRFVRQSVPEHLAHWPNHISGEIAYVEGYPTWDSKKSKRRSR